MCISFRPKRTVSKAPTKVHPPQTSTVPENKPARRLSRHVRFDDLPKPDRRNGDIIHSQPAPSMDLNLPAYGAIAQRRVEAEDAVREKRSKAGYEYWRRRLPDDLVPRFDEVKWKEDPHPGQRVPVDVFEDEMVSPRSSTIFLPQWNTEMHYETFRMKVQPTRIIGRRKPGMTARSAKTSREGEDCAVQ